MPRKKISIGDDTPYPSSDNQIEKTLFLTDIGVVGDTNEYDFISGDIFYFKKNINQSFEHILIDNIGTGSIRIAFNKLGLEMVNPITGAKTLKAGDTFFVDNNIRQLSIYYIDDSIVELVLISK